MSDLRVTRFTGASIVFNGLAKCIVNQIVEKERVKVRDIIEEESRLAIEEALKKVDVWDYFKKKMAQ